MEFRPYIGSRTTEHYGSQPGQEHTIPTYGSDRSHTVEYRFNRFGYRGSELREDAQRVIYVCGCSHTFGTGLAEKDAWPSGFAAKYAAHHGVGPDDLCLLNFSQGGGSNRYITRTLIDQCAVHKPNMVIAHFSEIGRTEYILEPGLFTGWVPHSDSRSVAAVGPWQNASWLKRQLWLRRDFRPVDRHAARHILRWTRAYYSGAYRLNRAVYETLQDMLTLQLYCQRHDIDFMMSCVEYDRLVSQLDNVAIRILWDLIDHDRLTAFAVSDASSRVDRAADDGHPGPKSHQLFVEKLWESYREAQSSSNASS